MKALVIVAIAASVALTGAFAQTSEAGQRAENQQDRIANGVQSGQLTAGETSRLEGKEAAIGQEVHTDRSLNGGKLTGQERAIVNQQQNRVSGQIYNDKHNARVQNYGNSEVGQRQANQQARIAQGIRSGNLKAGQTARLEKGEAGVNQEVHADRAINGGKLTPGEKAQVNRRQNRMSGKIYKAKHS